MGNQPSKGDKKGDDASVLKTPSLSNYPSFGKSDTKDSTRSLRGSIRSKIPGSAKSDSPRGSTSALSDIPDTDGTGPPVDATDGPSPKSPPLPATRPNTSIDSIGAASIAESELNDFQPPPSPSQSASLNHGHSDVDKAQRSGEVDHVSDQPPTAVTGRPSQHQKAGESILKKSLEVPVPESRFRRKSRSKSRDRGFNVSYEGVDGSNGLTIKDIDLDETISRLLDAGYAGKVTKTVCLKNAEIFAICSAARELFLNQPALLELAPPVKIVGDVHGQYTDLIRMFEMCGFPPSANFLFLGDYVDRGKQSLETILLLFCYKLKFPENFFLLRGNHESANVTRVYGFYDECKRRTNIKVWKAFIDTFNCLPIAAIVAGKIFCVHGGLSPELKFIDDIKHIERPTDVPDVGLLNDLLWSDPTEEIESSSGWDQSDRGVSYHFGKSVIMDFLQRNDFDLVCRAHMVVEDGYEFFSDRVLVTVFSAPNYCGEFDNWGAVMSVSGELLCSFELLKPLDSSALKSHIKKGRKERMNALNSPPASNYPQSY